MMMTKNLSLDKGFVDAKTAGVLGGYAKCNFPTMNSSKDPFCIAFSENLRAAMAASNIDTASKLATMMGAGDSRVRNWCNGTSSPTAKEAIQLAQLLGVTLDWLFRGISDGLLEAKRIRVIAAKHGLSPPPQMDDHEVDGAFSAEAALVPAHRRRAARKKAIAG